jgi:hypothetical protein
MAHSYRWAVRWLKVHALNIHQGSLLARGYQSENVLEGIVMTVNIKNGVNPLDLPG